MVKRPSAINGGADSVRFHDLLGPQTSFLADVLSGLARPQKSIPPKYFYDEAGSHLFEAICELSEYYPTRTEIALMQTRIGDIAARLGSGVQLIEFGSGASTKTRMLIEALRPTNYVPIDISESALHEACERLHLAYPALHINAVCADFTQALNLRAPIIMAGAARVVYFPGSTIGNFTRAAAHDFLRNIAAMLGSEGKLLIGVDLKKDHAVLEAAYDDAQGVTARFNLNLLARMNRELGADFRVEQFRHRAFYDETLGRIEMHLESLVAQTVRIAGQRFDFRRGETIHTEISCKYSVSEFQDMGRAAGFLPLDVWTDAERLFSVHLMSVRLPN
ncbi:MAG TPA: L-histidine N(alpha)-methyltransferase [Burkholderiales bacterium]